MEERTELVTLFVTKEEKEKFLELDGNLKAQEQLVFNHLNTIKRRLEQEIKITEDMFSHFDERVKYLSENLGDTETRTAKELEEIYDKIEPSFQKLFSVSSKGYGQINSVIKDTLDKLKDIEKSLERIDFKRAERFVDILERFSSLTKEDKELYKLLLERKL